MLRGGATLAAGDPVASTCRTIKFPAICSIPREGKDPLHSRSSGDRAQAQTLTLGANRDRPPDPRAHDCFSVGRLRSARLRFGERGITPIELDQRVGARSPSPKLSGALRRTAPAARRSHSWSDRPDAPRAGDAYGDATIAPVRAPGVCAGRSGLPARCAWAPALARLPLSWRGDAGRAQRTLVTAAPRQESSSVVAGARRR